MVLGGIFAMRTHTAIVTAAGLLAVLLTGRTAATAPAHGTIQVTGTQLKSALLPASPFGSGGVGAEQDSGRTVKRSANVSAGTMSCSLFSVLLGDASLPGDQGFGFGSTAYATEQVLVTGRTNRTYRQAVYQFPSPPAAAALVAQTYAKYGSCRSISLSGERIRLESESRTRVGSHQALVVEQLVSYPGAYPALPAFHAQALLSIDGPVDGLES